MKVTWTRPYVVDITRNFLQFVSFEIHRLMSTIHHLTQLVGSYFLNEDHERRRRWNQLLYFRNLTRFYLLKLKQHPSSRNVIFQTKGKIIFLSTIYLSLNTKLSKTNFRRMQRRTRSLLHDLRQTKRSKHRSISFFERIRTMSLEGNRRAFPIPPRRLQDSDLTVVTCSIPAIVRRS